MVRQWLTAIGEANCKRVVIHDVDSSSFWSGDDALFILSLGTDHGGTYGKDYGHDYVTFSDFEDEFPLEVFRFATDEDGDSEGEED